MSDEPVQTDAQAMALRRLPPERSVKARNRSSGSETSPLSAVTTSAPADPGRASQITFNQAIESIVSPRASHAQKETAWKQLRESGKLDQAIGELEQRAASNAGAAEYPAALGQAYLQKCGTIQDVREQGILAMKADQVFDAALNLDSNNWEARFTKALAMSYWPTQMNRGTEVMQHFVTLVEQQEAQTPQPHFAQTYARLGDEYLKYGHAEYAKQAWQRGAALFPEDRELRLKLQAQ
jgi:tetratricopeptide (TPR) repeat protein